MKVKYEGDVPMYQLYRKKPSNMSNDSTPEHSTSVRRSSASQSTPSQLGILSQAVQRLGASVDASHPPTIEEDYFLDGEGRVYSLINLDSRISELQAKYRRLDVVVVPDPLLLLEVSKMPQRKEVALILISSSEYGQIVERITPHLQRRHRAVEKVNIPSGGRSERELALLMVKLRSVSFILGVGTDRIISSLILGSGTQHCLLNPKHGRYGEYLSQLGLSSLTVLARDYNSFKPAFQNSYSMSSSSDVKLPSILEGERRKAQMVQRCLSHMKKMGPLAPPKNMREPPYSCYCCPRTYQSPWMKSLALQFSVFNGTTGPWLELTTYNSMVEMKVVHCYPWIGIVEVMEHHLLSSLLSCDEWRNSLPWCRGLLFIGTRKATKPTRELLKNLNLNLISVPLPLLELEESFDHISFLSRPRLVFYGESTTILSLPAPEPDPPSESESSEEDSEGSGSESEDSEGSESEELDPTIFPDEEGDDNDYGGEVDNELVKLGTGESTSDRNENENEEEDDGEMRLPLEQLLRDAKFNLNDEDDEDTEEVGNEGDHREGEIDTAPESTDGSTKHGRRKKHRSSNGEKGNENHYETEIPSSFSGPSNTEGTINVRRPPPPLQDEPLPTIETPTYYYQSMQRNSSRDSSLLRTCIPVIEGDEIEILLQAISRRTPPLIRPGPLTMTLLGPEYPLYSESLNPLILGYICTPSRVMAAIQFLEHLSSKIASPVPRFMNSLEKLVKKE